MDNGKLYAGFTHDLRRRLKEHKIGKDTTTKKYLPVELIFYEAYKNEEDARRREKYFKTNKGKTVLKIMLNKTLGSF